MSDKIEGTLKLDGMIQGRFDGSQTAQDALGQWRRDAQARGLRFNLQMEGSSFNLLAEDAPIIAASLQPKPELVIVSALEDLWQSLRPHARGETLSTVRSSQYQPGCEIQTLYVFAADGKVQFRQRTSDAHTVAPPQPLTRREKLKLCGIGLAAIVVVFLVSAIFVDYPNLISGMVRQAMPFNAEKVDVVTKDFDQYFNLDQKSISSDGKSLLLKLKRTVKFPRTDQALDASLAGAGPSMRPRLMLDSIARGYVRFECFDDSGAFVGYDFGRISDLRTSDVVTVSVPISADKRLAKVVFTY